MSPRWWPRDVIAAIGDATWLTRGRVIAWCWAVMVGQSILLAAVVLWEFGFFGPSRSPFVSDFPSFYAAGSLALQGLPELAYDETAHWFAEQALSGAAAPYIYFFYPPPFLLLCASLAMVPYWLAVFLFEALSLAAYVLVARRVAAIGGWGWCVPALAFPAVFWCLGLGQNSFLTAALLGGGTLLVDRKPLLAGLLFGLLCYKPQFGLLVPVALVAGGHWRALFAAAATLCAVVGVTFWLFGVETWLRYLEAFARAEQVYGSHTILLAGYVSPFAAGRLVGLSAPDAMSLQLLVSLATMFIVGWIWFRKFPLPIRGAALIAGTVLSGAVVLLYDLTLASIGIAWLVQAGVLTGFPRWEKALLALLYGLTLLTLPVGWMLHVPIGVLVPAIILGLCVRRAKANAA